MQFFVVLLVGYAIIFMAHILDGGLKQKVSQFTALDWIAIGFVPTVLISILYLSAYYKRSFHKNENLIYLASLVVIAASLFLAISFDPNNKTTSAILASGALATIGWLATNLISSANIRKSHTMNVLMQMRNSAEMRFHRNNVFAHYSYDLPVIPKADFLQLKADRGNVTKFSKDTAPVIESMFYICNYCEFICAAVELGDLDDSLIRNTLRGTLIANYDFYKELIDDAKTQPDGTTNKRVYEHFTNVVARYRK